MAQKHREAFLTAEFVGFEDSNLLASCKYYSVIVRVSFVYLNALLRAYSIL